MSENKELPQFKSLMRKALIYIILFLEGLFMKLVKRISMNNLMGMFAALALMLSVTSASNACFFAFAQPKVPQGLDKFVKNN